MVYIGVSIGDGAGEVLEVFWFGAVSVRCGVLVGAVRCGAVIPHRRGCGCRVPAAVPAGRGARVPGCPGARGARRSAPRTRRHRRGCRSAARSSGHPEHNDRVPRAPVTVARFPCDVIAHVRFVSVPILETLDT